MTETSWLESLRALKAGFDELQRQANKLRQVPDDAPKSELREAWMLLASTVECGGYAPSAFALDHLQTIWGRQGGTLAGTFADTLRQLAGRIQCSTAPSPSIPSTDFGNNLVVFCGTDCACPAHAVDRLMIFGPYDALPEAHVLRQRIAREECYWIGESYDYSRRFGFVCAAAVRNPHNQFVAPDMIVIEDCLRWTILSATEKRQRRQQAQWEFERKEQERHREEEEWRRRQRFIANGPLLLEQLERELAETKSKLENANGVSK